VLQSLHGNSLYSSDGKIQQKNHIAAELDHNNFLPSPFRNSNNFDCKIFSIGNFPLIFFSFQSQVSWMSYLSIVGVLGFVICYGIALGPIPYFIGSELFEVGPRPSAMALGSMANWGGNFVVGLFFQIMLTYLGAGSFFIFAAVVVALFFFVR
jgi:hypothetical protein